MSEKGLILFFKKEFYRPAAGTRRLDRPSLPDGAVSGGSSDSPPPAGATRTPPMAPKAWTTARRPSSWMRTRPPRTTGKLLFVDRNFLFELINKKVRGWGGGGQLVFAQCKMNC